MIPNDGYRILELKRVAVHLALSQPPIPQLDPWGPDYFLLDRSEYGPLGIVSASSYVRISMGTDEWRMDGIR
jgi:hypothetical protein